MNVLNVKKYVGKKVLLELKNGFKFTAVIPDFSGDSFEIIDKFNKNVSIDTSMIALVYEIEQEKKERKKQNENTD